MAVAGLVLGIVAIVLSLFGGWFSIIALPIAIVGLVLSIIARKKQPSGVATAGLVIGIIAVVITAIFFFTCGICVLCVASAIEEAAGGDIENALNDIANQLSSIQ